MFRCKLRKHVQTIELRGELQSGVQSFEAGRTERIRQVDSGVNCQTMQAGATGFTCDVCQRPCVNRADVVAHGKVHSR